MVVAEMRTPRNPRCVRRWLKFGRGGLAKVSSVKFRVQFLEIVRFLLRVVEAGATYKDLVGVAALP